MRTERITRRGFAARAATLLPGLVALGPVRLSRASRRSSDDAVTHTSEAIRQMLLMSGTPDRVYAALTDERQFARVVELSGAMAKASAGSVAATISPAVDPIGKYLAA